MVGYCGSTTPHLSIVIVRESSNQEITSALVTTKYFSIMAYAHSEENLTIKVRLNNNKRMYVHCVIIVEKL